MFASIDCSFFCIFVFHLPDDIGFRASNETLLYVMESRMQVIYWVRLITLYDDEGTT